MQAVLVLKNISLCHVAKLAGAAPHFRARDNSLCLCFARASLVGLCDVLGRCDECLFGRSYSCSPLFFGL